MTKTIHYAGPWITDKEVECVADAARNGFYENYKVHATRLEETICERLEVPFALATNSCTAAIHLALAAAGIEPGDEVITTDSSCVASAVPILYCGATAVFVDVDPLSWCLSPEAILKSITPKTRCILPVHWNGIPCDMAKIMSIARDHDLLVIEDAAPSLGAEHKGTKVGTIGNAGCFSFQGAKVAIGGQGGVLVTRDEKLHRKAQVLASYGRTDSVMQYWSDHIGFNYTMPNLPAALAQIQVERLGELITKKRQIHSWYAIGLDGVPHVRLISESPGDRSTYCYPALLLQDNAKCTRAELLVQLREDNIDSRPAQPRISKMPMFESRSENRECEKIEQRGVILPSAFNLTESDIAFVCQRIRALV